MLQIKNQLFKKRQLLLDRKNDDKVCFRWHPVIEGSGETLEDIIPESEQNTNSYYEG